MVFKKITARLLLSGILTLIPFYAIAQNSNNTGNVRIAFLSDLHLKSTAELNNLFQTISHAKKQGIDALLIGGDLVDNGNSSPEQWTLVKELIDTFKDSLALYFIPGNHDSDWHGTLPGLTPTSPVLKDRPFLYRDMNIDMIAKFKQLTGVDAIQTFKIKNAAFFLFYDYGYFSEISNVSKVELESLLPAMQQFFSVCENTPDIENIILMVHSPLADLNSFNIGSTIKDLAENSNKNVVVLSGHIHKNKVISGKPLNIIVAPDTYRLLEFGNTTLKTIAVVNKVIPDSVTLIDLSSVYPEENGTDANDLKIYFDTSTRRLHISEYADKVVIYTLEGKIIMSSFGDEIDLSTIRKGICLVNISVRNKLSNFKVIL